MAAAGESPDPMTLTSSGTRIPSWFSAISAPIATSSVAQMSAFGRLPLSPNSLITS